MTVEEFVNKYNGVKVDFDNYAGAQCVDLFRQYNKDVKGFPHTGSCVTSGGAKDLYLDYDKMPVEKKHYKKLSKTAKVDVGDVAIWGETPKNKFGHVAIVIGTLGNSLIVFEQDGFKQDGAKTNVRTTASLLGYLRAR